MYTGILHSHSVLRYFILILLVVVIIQSLLGLVNKKPYTKMDNRVGLFLFICTHTQLLLGIVLYFVSPWVQGPGATTYWRMEHSASMLIAIVLITLARTTSKKMTSDQAKHKRMLIFNIIALVIIIATIWRSARGIV